MTPETQLIWNRISQEKRATVQDMVSWTGRESKDAGVTIGLMIAAGQLKFLRRRNEDGVAEYGPGIETTFGIWRD